MSRAAAEDEPVCPLCRTPLAEIGTEHLVPPFWSRFPFFFAYPLHPRALLPLVGVAVASSVAGYTSLPGLAMQAALFLLLYKLAYSSLSRMADGFRDPPPPAETLTGKLGPAIKQFVVFFIILMPLTPLSMFFGPVGAGLYVFLFTVVTPASIMVLAVTESIGSAINPGMLAGTIRNIGPAYLALLGLVTLLGGGPTVFQEFLMNHVGSEFQALIEQFQADPESVDPEALNAARESFTESLYGWVIPLMVFVQGYFTLVTFALMGYVLYQYHGKLGLSVVVDVETGTEGERRNEHPLLGDIEVLTREGRLEDAARVLRERVVANRDDMKLRERFHRLLAAIGDVDKLCGHGAEYIGKLLDSSNAAKAAEVYRDCRRANADFRLDKPEQVLPLASVMFQTVDHAGVVALASGFHRSAPDHADIPELYYLAARALSEGMDQDAKARPILGWLLKKYPDHPIAPTVRQYAEALKGLETRPA